jgi:hypothetical protein
MYRPILYEVFTIQGQYNKLKLLSMEGSIEYYVYLMGIPEDGAVCADGLDTGEIRIRGGTPHRYRRRRRVLLILPVSVWKKMIKWKKSQVVV